MPSHWLTVDRLMRELGAVRSESLALDPTRVGNVVMEEVEAIIGAAATAVDTTLDRPDDDDLVFHACEAIVEARARIEALRVTASRSRDLVARSVAIRRQSAQRLYTNVLGQPGRKPGA